MTGRFSADGRLFFTELLLDDTVIASTSNLVSDGAGFAFKIGWDARYARMAPGYLNEVEFIRHMPASCGDLSFIDSGTSPGSFIEELWVSRRALVSGVFTTSALGDVAARAIGTLRRVRNRWWRRDAPNGCRSGMDRWKGDSRTTTP
jgi:hypothetical protein